MRRTFILVCFFLNCLFIYAQECEVKLETARYYRTKNNYKEAVKFYKAVLSSCGDYDGNVAKELRECERVLAEKSWVFILKQTKLECEGYNGTFTMELSKAPASWEVIKHPEWLEVSSVNLADKKVIFRVKANPDAERRKGTIALKSDKGKTQEFTVFQKEGEAKLRVEEEELDFGGGGGRETVTVVANCDWTCQTSATWLRLVKQDNNSFMVTCSANELVQQRYAVITVSGKNVSRTISVTQFEGDTYFSVSGITNHAIYFDAYGGENSKLRVISNDNWRMENKSPWIILNALGNNIVVQCEPNPWAEVRSASFDVVTSSEGLTKTILVEQSGAEPKLEKLSFPYKGGERKYVSMLRPRYRIVDAGGDKGEMQVKVHTNVKNWDFRIVPDDVDWMTGEASRRDGILKLDIDNNNAWENREADVLISAMGIQDTLHVRQGKRGYRGILNDYFADNERVWKTTRFFVDLYALESIGFRIGGLAKRWKFVEFSLLDFDVEYAHKSLFLDWEPIVRGYLPISRGGRRWSAFMGMGISVNMLGLELAPEIQFSYFGSPHFLFEFGAEYHWVKKENVSSRIFYRYDGFSSFGISFDLYKWTKKWK